MTCVTVSYIFFAPEGFSSLTQYLLSTSIPYELAIGAGIGVAFIFLLMFMRWQRGLAAETGRLAAD